MNKLKTGRRKGDGGGGARGRKRERETANGCAKFEKSYVKDVVDRWLLFERETEKKKEPRAHCQHIIHRSMSNYMLLIVFFFFFKASLSALAGTLSEMHETGRRDVYQQCRLLSIVMDIFFFSVSSFQVFHSVTVFRALACRKKRLVLGLCV